MDKVSKLLEELKVYYEISVQGTLSPVAIPTLKNLSLNRQEIRIQ